MDEQGDVTRVINPLIGVKLGGQYTVLSVLGEGGMGTIYRGIQDMVDRAVAIKFLPAAQAQDEVQVQRLAREAKALGRLNHENIVKTFDFGFTDKNEPYLVFELVQGESLQTYLQDRGQLPYAQCVPMFIQLADAMKYAHANGIVHRDLKPHNIMVIQKEGKISVKILDFGIAQMKSESQKLTRAGEIWGSPNYMSPEQCTGEIVDHLTDIYSLGVVMYRALTGQLPHQAKSFAATVSKKLTEPVPFFGSLELAKPLEVPSGLEEIVIKCLRRHTDERYQSMVELRAALVAFAHEHNLDDGNASANYGDNSQLGQPAKAMSVTRPNTLFKPDQAKSIQTKKQAKNSTTNAAKAESAAEKKASSKSSTAQGAQAAKGKKAGQNKLAAMIVPLVALFAVLMVGAIGILVGMALDDRSRHATQVVKPVPQPPVQTQSKIQTPTANSNTNTNPNPTTNPNPAQAVTVPTAVTDPAPPKREEKSEATSPPILEKPTVVPAEKAAVHEHSEPSTDREAKIIVHEEAKPAHKQAHHKHAAVHDQVPHAASGEEATPSETYHVRAGDPNDFYRRFGGARDSK